VPRLAISTGAIMNWWRVLGSMALAGAGGVLAACATSSVAPQPAASSSIRPEELVGRWGYAAYYDEKDRARIQAAAKAQCTRPVIISRGKNGGIVMPMVNQSGAELAIKGGPGGKNYIGPPGDAGGQQDSEIVSFDGNVLITRTIAADETGHANSVYVRCGPKA
jgi:hypothetical protein